MRVGISLALCAAAASLGACGGSSNSGGGTCTPGSTASITIKSTGVTPMAVCIVPGGSVTFTNTDTATHELVSDASCTELDTGMLGSGATAMVTFPSAKTCSFHDSVSASNTAFQGTVAVTSAPVGGPGY
jgi:plastocyanin